MIDPIVGAAIAQGIAALIEIWRANANKPPEWVPSPEEWDAMLAFNDVKTANQYKVEAAARLGIQWPPSPNPS